MPFLLPDGYTQPVHSDAYFDYFSIAALIGIRSDTDSARPGARCTKEGLRLGKGELLAAGTER